MTAAAAVYTSLHNHKSTQERTLNTDPLPPTTPHNTPPPPKPQVCHSVDGTRVCARTCIPQQHVVCGAGVCVCHAAGS